MKKQNLDRRDFLKKTGAAALAFTIIPRHVLGGQGYMADRKSTRLNSSHH